MKNLKQIEGSCAPCALQYLSKKSDSAVIEAVLSRGLYDEDWKAVSKVLGVKLRRVFIKPQRVKRFLRLHQDGVYLVATFDHVFVVDNGQMIDPRCPNPPGLSRTIKEAWRVL